MNDPGARASDDWRATRRGRRRLLWLCVAVGLVAATTVLVLFGVSLWAAAGIAVLIACPVVVAWVLLIERRVSVPPAGSER